MKNRIPTFEEVLSHFSDPSVQKIHNISPSSAEYWARRFFDYYDSVGWYRGKTPTKKWRACLTQWQSSFSDTPDEALSQKDRMKLNIQRRLERREKNEMFNGRG